MTSAEEERYFKALDAELMGAQREVQAARASRDALAGVVGSNDEVVLADLTALGFTANTASLVPLLPLLQVAWSEGHVTAEEREVILSLARERGIVPESIADTQLLSWLSDRPHDATFQSGLQVLARIFATRPSGASSVILDELFGNCARVAAASGGFMGLTSNTSSRETRVIDRIKQVLLDANP
ncbi:MAG: hypothetical protein ABI877_01045 [Gemmatimonadaceae bacterium]